MNRDLNITIKRGMLVRDVAKYLGIHPVSVRRLASQHKLHPIKVGATLLFEKSEVEAFKKVYNPTKGSGKISRKGDETKARGNQRMLNG